MPSELETSVQSQNRERIGEEGVKTSKIRLGEPTGAQHSR